MKWMVTGTHAETNMKGSKVGDEIVMYITEKQNDQFGTYTIRITFYDIRKDSYKWKQDFLFDNGLVVEKTTFYTATRL